MNDTAPDNIIERLNGIVAECSNPECYVCEQVRLAAALIAEMRDALTPFAEQAGYADFVEAGDGEYLECVPLKAGTYRKARAALAKVQQ